MNWRNILKNKAFMVPFLMTIGGATGVTVAPEQAAFLVDLMGVF